MRKRFDKEKMLKLMEEKKILENQGKLLENFDKAKSDELFSYRFWIDDQIFWESRKDYIQILDLFVSQKTTVDQFLSQFLTLRSSNMNSGRMLKKNFEQEACGISTQSNQIDFQVNPESYKFARIIENIHSCIDLYDSDVTVEMNLEEPDLIWYGLSEEYLRILTEKAFLPQLEKYCNKF